MLGLCKCFSLQHNNSSSHNDRFQSHITAWLAVYKEDTSSLEIHFYSLHSTSINYTPIRLCNKNIHLSKNRTKTSYNFAVEYVHFGNVRSHFNPLNPELNPICYLLALLGAHHFLHVSRIRVKLLTLR